MVDTSTTHVVCCHRMRIFNMSFTYLLILFWLANNIQSSVLATVIKLGMLVVMGTSTTHMVCRHQMHIFNISISVLIGY